MNDYGNHLPACSGGSLCCCSPSKSQIMTFNLIARKNLFRLSEFFKLRAHYACRRGQNTRAKFFLMAWEKLLDTRDKLR